MRAAAERWAPWVAGAVLLAGVASFTATRLVGGTPASTGATTTAASVQLDAAARTVAREFVATAVARRDLARAWLLAAPSLRGHLTRAEWLTGNIPVQPYPVARATVVWAVEDSRADSALLQLTFVPRAGSGAQAGDFMIGLARVDGRWLVSSYTAASTIAPAPGG